MKIRVLGTGTSTGVPMIACACEVCTSSNPKDKRLRVSVYIEIDELCLCIDTGPDFRQQILRENITKLDAVLFTHEHKDHTAGLDDVRAFNFIQKSDMPCYGRGSVLEQIKQEFAYAFVEHKYPGIPRINLKEIHNQPFEIQGVGIIPIDVMHHLLPVFGFRINDFAYITDVNFIPDSELEKLQNLEVLIMGALQHSEHPSHYTLPQAIEIAKKINAKKTYFTHISHRMGLHEITESQYLKPVSDSIFLAYDGLKIEI